MAGHDFDLDAIMARPFEGGRRQGPRGYHPPMRVMLDELREPEWRDLPDRDTDARGVWEDAVADQYDPDDRDDIPMGYCPRRWDSERNPF